MVDDRLGVGPVRRTVQLRAPALRPFIGAGTGTASSAGFDPAAQDGCTLGDNRFIDEILREQGRAAPPSVTLDVVIARASCLWVR